MSQSKRGRPKGSPNKLTIEVKSMILEVFDKLGGVDGMVEWVRSDPANATIFYGRIIPKMLPRPALDALAAAAAAVPTGGVFTWRTPEWAKKVNKAQFKAGVAQVGKAARPKAGGGPGAPEGKGWAIERRTGEPPPYDGDDD